MPSDSKAAATVPAMRRRRGSPAMELRQPTSSRLVSPLKRFEMSAPCGQEALVETEVVGDLAHEPGADRDRGRGCLHLPAVRGQPNFVRRERQPRGDGFEDLGRRRPAPDGGHRTPRVCWSS